LKVKFLKITQKKKKLLTKHLEKFLCIKMRKNSNRERNIGIKPKKILKMITTNGMIKIKKIRKVRPRNKQTKLNYIPKTKRITSEK
jgi:hypothetical protein